MSLTPERIAEIRARWDEPLPITNGALAPLFLRFLAMVKQDQNALLAEVESLTRRVEDAEALLRFHGMTQAWGEAYKANKPQEKP